MSITQNIENIGSDIESFLTGLAKDAVAPIQTALASGGTNLEADGAAILSVAGVAASVLGGLPGAVGTYATEAEAYIPLATELYNVFKSGIAAVTGSPNVVAAAGAAATAVSSAASDVAAATTGAVATDTAAVSQAANSAAAGFDGLGDSAADTGAL